MLVTLKWWQQGMQRVPFLSIPRRTQDGCKNVYKKETKDGMMEKRVVWTDGGDKRWDGEKLKKEWNNEDLKEV